MPEFDDGGQVNKAAGTTSAPRQGPDPNSKEGRPAGEPPRSPGALYQHQARAAKVGPTQRPRRRVSFDTHSTPEQLPSSGPILDPLQLVGSSKEFPCDFGLLSLGGVYALEALHFSGPDPIVSHPPASGLCRVTASVEHSAPEDGKGTLVIQLVADTAGDIDQRFHLLCPHLPTPEGSPSKLTVHVRAIVMGRGKGKPQLHGNIRRVSTLSPESSSSGGSDQE
mmetsp:Transcript_21382/g.59341  ORF Transcript_21382/g.59341 Transcript_21382/m.59341 type:complete len:223 (+) Transcript_21382:182-850(+)